MSICPYTLGPLNIQIYRIHNNSKIISKININNNNNKIIIIIIIIIIQLIIIIIQYNQERSIYNMDM